MIINAILISLKVVFIATFFSFMMGIILGRVFTRYDFKFKSLIETIILCPMFLPPSVLGYLLLILIGKNGIIGKFLYDTFKIQLVFTWQGAAIAAFVVSFSIMYNTCKSTFNSLNPSYEESAKVMGASEYIIFKDIILPLSKRGIITGLILSFARAFGEFGATIMVAGNIPSKTQTVPMAIYYAVESGNTKDANIMMIFTIVLGMVLVIITNKILKNVNTYN